MANKFVNRWTPDEDSLLIKLYPNYNVQQLARILRRTTHSINHRAIHLGLRRFKFKPIDTNGYKDSLPEWRIPQVHVLFALLVKIKKLSLENRLHDEIFRLDMDEFRKVYQHYT